MVSNIQKKKHSNRYSKEGARSYTVLIGYEDF